MNPKLNHINSRSFGLLLALTVLVVSLSLVYFALRGLAANRNDQVHQAEVKTQNLAMAIDQSLSATIRQIDQALLTVVSEMETGLASGHLDLPRMKKFIATQEKLLPEAVAIRVTNADGVVILNSPIEAPSANFTDRPFWVPLRDHPDAGLLITKPILGTFTKKWVLAHARRYNLPDGRFGGAVVIPVFVEHFQAVLSRFEVGTGEVLSLRGSQGEFLTRHPSVVKGRTLAVGDKEVSTELRAILASGVPERTYRMVVPFDGARKTLSFRLIKGAPLCVIAGLEEDEYLTPWHIDRRRILTRVGFTVFGIWILAAFIWFIWLGRERETNALLASRRQYRSLVETTPDLVTKVDMEGRIEFVNHASKAIYGLTPEECLGRLAFDFIAPEDRDRTLSAFDAWLKSDGVVFEFENRQVSVDGQIHDMAWLISPECDEKGELVGFSSTARDITERKRADDSLRESEATFRKLFEDSSDPILLIDGTGVFVKYNEAALDLLKMTREQFLLLPPARISPEFQPDGRRSAEAAPEMIALAHSKGLHRFEWTHVNAEGGEFIVEVSLMPITIKGQVMLHTTWRDITERKMAEFAMKEGLARFKAMFNVSPIPFALNNAEGKISFLNPAFTASFGYTAKDLPNLESWWRQAYPDPGYRAWVISTWGELMDRSEQEGKPSEPFEVKICCRDGSERFVIVTSVGLRGVQEATNLVALYDITERKQTEEEKSQLLAQLQQSQKMESLGTLAGGVAHDMNNVLGAILGLASAHIGTQPPGSPLYNALDTICKATERGGKMVKSLLSFARQSPAEVQALDMNSIVKDQVALLERTTLARVRLQMALEADLRPIIGDPSALAHAFMNLCVNAVDAMPEDGILTLRTHNVDNDWIEVVVQDNGRGMTKEVLEKAMDPFFTTKETGKGTGLGLSMVFSTVKAHQGQMAIESEPGQGTRVMIRFPACEQEAPVQAAEPSADDATQPPHGTLKLLLVDDDELIQSSVQAVLEVLGHTAVTIAPSGEEALILLEAGLEVDLVILDMNMPGLGGIGTLPRLRALRPEVPVLLATGRVDQTALTLASAHPGVTLLPKPFGLRELQKHIEKIGLG